MASLVRAVACLAALAATIVGLDGAGHGLLQAPDPGMPLRLWAAERDAVTIVFVLLRLLTLAAAWYLLAMMVLTVLAGATRNAVFAAAVRLLTWKAARRLLHAAAGVSVTTALVAPGPVAAEVVEGEQLPLPPALDKEPPAATAPPAVERPRAPGPSADHMWTVAPGDHFWSIAQRHVARSAPRPSRLRVARYWLRLVESNRSRLVDPANPDLLHPGQVLRLPPL